MSQTTSLHIYQAFPSTPEGYGKWKKLKEQFCEPRTLDSSVEQDKFKLTKERITVYRHKEKQASSIIASSVNDSTIKKIASIAYSMAKLTHNNIVMINNGSEKQIVDLCKELDKFTRPKLIIKLSPTLMQNKSLLHALATTMHHHLRSSTKF